MSVADAVIPDTSRPVESHDELERRGRRQELRGRKEELKLRRRYGKAALLAAAIQLGITDLVFVAFAVWRVFDLSERAMIAWLASTVVQVIAVVLVITRSLFPHKPPPPG